MPAFSIAELRRAAARIHEVLPRTPQYVWPLLAERAGAELWVKHENHLPIGSFKVRGGLLYMESLAAAGVGRVIAATRGNHGQSVAFAARHCGLHATIVVPERNSVEKNAAMRAFGADLVVHGDDFQDAFDHARELSVATGAAMVPSFSMELVRGVASYGLELFEAVPALDVVYVPIGLGSGICGVTTARDALGNHAEIVGVVAEGAPTYALSFAAGRAVPTSAAQTIADGIACRVPDPDALALIRARVSRIVTVTDREIRASMRHYFADTHNVAEGAGAASLAAALRERDRIRGKRVAVILSGGNVDSGRFRDILDEASAGPTE